MKESEVLNLIENAPLMWRKIDARGKILDCNDTYAAKLGYSKEEIIDSNIFDHISEKSITNLKESYETWKNTGNISNMEVWFVKKDKTEFPALISANSIYDKNNKLVGSNSFIQDISQIKSAGISKEWERIEKLSTIGELSERIVRDLQQPISDIKINLDILQTESKEQLNKSKKLFEDVVHSVSVLEFNVNNILDFIRPKSLGDGIILISETIDAVKKRIVIPKKITIQQIGDPVSIRGDRRKLEIVFSNIIMNAMQAMKYSGTITIETSNYSKNSQIKIIDSGPGIPTNKLSKIFDSGFSTRKIGTGLGLPSCKKIIEEHGGTIRAETKRGKGTTFIISIPKS